MNEPISVRKGNGLMPVGGGNGRRETERVRKLRLRKKREIEKQANRQTGKKANNLTACINEAPGSARLDRGISEYFVMGAYMVVCIVLLGLVYSR